MLSNLLALGCIAAIAIILSLHDEKPLPDWPALISVNSLAAVVTAVFKASLIMPVAEGLAQLKWNWFRHPRKLADIVLFDDASRGPWGSLLIIKQLPRPQKAIVAGMGCIITIAALAIDPISQAMIEHRTCYLTREPSDLELANVPRANYYTACPTSLLTQVSYSIDPIMEAALNKGLIDPEETETQIKAQCSTDNCTFTQGNDGYFFSSLAMIHFCQDVTDRVVKNSTDTWHLKGSTLQLAQSSDMVMLSIAETPENYNDDQRPFLSFDILMATFPDPECKKGCGLTLTIAPLAVQCRLDPGVKRYKGEITNGIYRETEDKEPSQMLKIRPTTDGDNDYAWTLVTNFRLIDGEEKSCYAVADEAPQYVRVDSTWNTIYGYGAPSADWNVTWNYYPQECDWAMSLFAGDALRYSLANLIGESVTAITDIGASEKNVNGPLWLKKAYARGQGNLSVCGLQYVSSLGQLDHSRYSQQPW
ncbi:hypothetical protein CMUS01_09144 [Colletotrichum musicola]|uniref:Uncharacterized protein n=1 Tax=Colletotrichum musicola TaxID=2175873 RepID=A0A8H6K8X6_9PEZI|nr:hypothetical protein CMUS01_09144 [Colletotrichum musicola]